MKSLLDFIKAFLRNNGQFVFLSLLIAKICAFAGSVLMVRILPENEFGVLTIAATVFAVFSPFSGFGSTQSLMRFGSLCDDEKAKSELSDYLFKKGFINQLLLSIVFFLFAFVYINQYSQIFLIFSFFTIRLVGVYFFYHIQSERRIHFKNRDFARMNNVVNISGLLMMLLFTYYWGLLGYLIANALAPFISLFWFQGSIKNAAPDLHQFGKKEIWSFALHASSTALLSDAFFSADILLLSFFKDENAVANYKIAILIPSNITFLALSFLQSDYPVLAKNFRSKEFLKNYIFNYYKIFIPVSAAIFISGYFLSGFIMKIFFGAEYMDNSFVFSLFLLAFCGSMLLRNLYGNLLAAVGMMKKNTLYSALSIIILSFFAFLLVPKDGLEGMAVAMSISLTLMGFFLMFSFLNYLRKLK